MSAYVYILSNAHNNVLYVGCTTELRKRIYLHRHRMISGFSRKYNVTKLVYFEEVKDVDSALRREHQLKAGSRAKKTALVTSKNSTWQDLYDRLK